MSITPISKKQQVMVYLTWLCKRAALIVFDVLACYLSYYLSLVMRFYANGSFPVDADRYLDAFYSFAPYYGVISIIVFALFGLYSGRWKYAGFSDLYRIVIANIITAIIQFAGTNLFLIDMPMTYYCLGSAMQFGLIFLSRFSYRMFIYFSDRVAAYRVVDNNAMIVGTGDTANYVRRHIETKEVPARVRCFFSIDASFSDGAINGVPVVRDFGRIRNYIESDKILTVYLAEPRASYEIVSAFRAVCDEVGVRFVDYSDALQVETYSLTFSKLMRTVSGPVRVCIGGECREFSSGDDARAGITGRYTVSSVAAENGIVTVVLSSKRDENNDSTAEWIKEQEQQTGESVSFF